MTPRRLRSHLLRLLPLLALATVAGCVRSGPPAPVVSYGHGGPAAAATAAAPAAARAPTAFIERPPVPHPDSVTVRSGETLYGIARRYDVPVRSIIDANHLTPPYRLLSGTRLALPQVRYHTVQPGDTLYSVSQHYGVDASSLARANHLTAPYTIRTGEPLVLPAPVERGPSLASSAPPPRSAASEPAAPQYPAPLTAAPSLAEVHPAAAPHAAERAAEAKPVPAPVSLTASSAPPAPASPQPAAAPAVLAAPPAEAKPPTDAKPDEQVAALRPPAVSGKGFIWPVHGRILSAYGPGPGGTHNDGVNIAAPEGTPVLAADAGEVAYAGNELRGYGYLILLKHANGYMTAYAHNSQLLVKRGDRVRRGQPIARVGATGTVGEPQLHFEIRRGTRALDPAEYLPAVAAAAASG